MFAMPNRNQIKLNKLTNFFGTVHTICDLGAKSQDMSEKVLHMKNVSKERHVKETYMSS